jgi:hypothetical protein
MIGEEIGLDLVAPMMGPFPVSDTFGMKIACTILHCTLDPAKHETHIQFASASVQERVSRIKADERNHSHGF